MYIFLFFILASSSDKKVKHCIEFSYSRNFPWFGRLWGTNYDILDALWISWYNTYVWQNVKLFLHVSLSSRALKELFIIGYLVISTFHILYIKFIIITWSTIIHLICTTMILLKEHNNTILKLKQSEGFISFFKNLKKLPL